MRREEAGDCIYKIPDLLSVPVVFSFFFFTEGYSFTLTYFQSSRPSAHRAIHTVAGKADTSIQPVGEERPHFQHSKTQCAGSVVFLIYVDVSAKANHNITIYFLPKIL